MTYDMQTATCRCGAPATWVHPRTNDPSCQHPACVMGQTLDAFRGDGPTWDVRQRRNIDGRYEHAGQVQAHDQNEARQLARDFAVVRPEAPFYVKLTA